MTLYQCLRVGAHPVPKALLETGRIQPREDPVGRGESARQRQEGAQPSFVERAVGLAPDTPFATKPQRARHMLERVLAAEPPVAWVTGDTRFRSKEGPPPPSDDDPGNPLVGFRGERRRNETHDCTDAVPKLLDELRERSYDTKDCVGAIRARRVTPHVAQKKKHSAIDGRTTRHASYTVSLRIRKQVEEVFGWMKTVGGFRCTRYRGVKHGLAGYLVCLAEPPG